jgi:hypothetical protein
MDGRLRLGRKRHAGRVEPGALGELRWRDKRAA